MIISVIAAKFAALFLHWTGRGGTTLPGKIALKLKPDILRRLSQGVRIVCVTGTNGKTTTCALIEHALKQGGYSYFINKSGANMLSGVVTAFIAHATITGKCKKEFAVLECDENSFPLMAKYMDAEVTAVTNLFRDQLDRYGEISHTLYKIEEGIDAMPHTVLVLNADCPLTYSISLNRRHRVYTFGINDNFKINSLSDARYCPVCQSELQYKTKIFAQLGDFYCPHCSYIRKNPDFFASCVHTEANGTSFIFTKEGGSRPVSVSLGGIYNVYNFCAASAVLHLLNIDADEALCSFTGAFGRMERFRCGDNTILILLVKNPVGLSGCIRYVCSVTGRLGIAFSLNDNEADGTDVSWIWDSDFTPLAAKSSKVYTLGKRSADMALRLKYDGILPDSVIEGEDYDALLHYIREDKTDFVIFATYTSMMRMRKRFIEEFGGKEFWK